MAVSSGLNRINVVVPANSPFQVVERDAKITFWTAVGVTLWQLYHYTDTSPLGLWGYYATGALLSANGIATVVTITCAGVTHPPNGSSITANPDPGPGTIYTWSPLGYPWSMSTSGDGNGGSVPQGNNNFYVWRIAGNSPTAVADFTTAITDIGAALGSAVLSGTVVQKYLKYVDSVSGAWQVYAVFFGAGSSEFGTTSTVNILPNNNILYMVTCSGSPNVPSGSPNAPVALPAFTQTFTTISSPLSFGPQR